MAGASIERIIKAAVDRGASDLHIKAGDVFRARISGRLVPLTKHRLTPEQTRAIAARLISNEQDRAGLDQIRDFDCSWGMSGIGRFRVNILKQRSSFMIVMRVLPFTLPTLETLNLPMSLGEIAESPSGLVIIAGVSGSGKSSTAAALLNHINQNQSRHIVTVEDPIEFLHRDLSSSITQREVGVDTQSVGIGLHAALRQDPDVIFVSDLDDAETLDTAIKAAETGHLVIATLPTPDPIATIRQVFATLPKEEQEIGRIRFSESLRAVIAQRLVNTDSSSSDRLPVLEILIATPQVRAIISEGSELERISAIMQKGASDGMTTFAKSLKELSTRESARTSGGSK